MNILIVGLGSIATKHINALKEVCGQVNIFALRSKPGSEIVEGITNIYDLDDTDTVFDFAIISNPTNLHYGFIELLADKGVDLFIEKPPVSSLENIDALIEKVDSSKSASYVACNLRFHPCLQFLKKKLSDSPKRINEVNIYCGSYLPDWRPGKNFREIYSANPEMGGGVHLDLFHELDYTYWLFGKPNKTSSIKRNVSSLEIKAYDYANYLFEYDGFAANIVMNYFRRDAKRTIEILFEDETWTVDLIRNTITDNNRAIIFSDNSFGVLKTYTDQMNYFINTLKVGKEQMNTFAESVEVLKLCLSNE
ncbi:Gfo/Idh/MocA family protein [Flavobacterium suzhouense]|uniref:Gfo/Idh/MocA family protein n=1 Tax=Flavobacterium suzhouense TaxID=1529638 RepID=A0ABW5NQ46_9FLAO